MTGQEIRELRERLGMTQFEFAIAVGVQGSTVSNWETGKYAVSPLAERSIRALAAAQEGKAG